MRTKIQYLLIALLILTKVGCNTEENIEEIKRKLEEENSKREQIERSQILQIDALSVSTIIQHFKFSVLLYYEEQLEQKNLEILKNIQSNVYEASGRNFSEPILFGTINIGNHQDLKKECDSSQKSPVCLYLNTKFKREKFQGQFTEQALLEWVVLNVNTRANVIKSSIDWEQFSLNKRANKILVGINKQVQDTAKIGDLIEKLIAIERFSENDVSDIYFVEDKEVFQTVLDGGKKIGFETGQVNFPFMILFKNTEFSEPNIIMYDGKLNCTDEITTFLQTETLPLVVRLSDKNFVRVFGGAVNTAVHLILDPTQDNSQLIKFYEKAALFNQYEQLKYQRAFFTYSYFGDALEGLSSQFQLSSIDETPFLGITEINHMDFSVLKFKYPENIVTEPTFDQNQIVEFLDDYRLKKIPIFYRSQEIPANSEWTDSNIFQLRQIVGKNFKEVVMKEQINFFCLFWDGKHKKSGDQYQLAVEKFIEVTDQELLKNKLRFCKLDLSLNEHERIQFDKAPVLALYHQGHKHKPIVFEGEPTIENLRGFLNYYVSNFKAQDPNQPILSLGGGPSLGGESIEKVDL